jgi:hypothetical protein
VKEISKTSHCAYRFEDLPEGFLGTLCFHQSGRVRLVIGNHQFDVNQGSECHFFQVSFFDRTLLKKKKWFF